MVCRFDPLSFQQDGVASAEVGIGRCQVADGLVVTLVVVVIDEGIDLGLEIARQVVVLEQDAVLQTLIPALDLAVGLGMDGSSPGVADAAVLESMGANYNLLTDATVADPISRTASYRAIMCEVRAADIS